MTSRLSTAPARPPAISTLPAALGPLVLAVFLGFLAVGAPLAALAVEVRDRLGFGAATVGTVVGLQALTTLLTRHRAGTFCDQRGPRAAVLLGLPIAAASGLLYGLSALLPLSPAGSLAVLLAGRIAVGLGESLFVTGLMSWGIARLGAARTGVVMSWTGIAIYAALGLGAPAGLLARSASGFAGVGALALAAPLLACAVVWPLAPVPAAGGERVPFHRVLGLIWRPGLVLALATVPFAALASFLALDYAAHGWPGAGTGLFGFGAAYVLVRLTASGLTDRVGATRVAAGSLGVEAAGQALLWFASTPGVAALGATVTGLGFSLVFPAMGVVATRSVPPGQRGRAVGNFIAFADVAVAVTGPAVGLASQSASWAGWAGAATAFLVGLAAAGAALCLLPSIRPGRGG